MKNTANKSASFGTSCVTNWARAIWGRPWLGFVVVFAFAFYQRWQMPRLILPDADSWGYLAPALLELSGGVFQQTFGRSLAYPLFLWVILRTTGSFEAIAVIQHSAGWLSGFVWAWTFFLWVSWLPAEIRAKPWIRWVGVMGIALFLLNGRMLVFEMLLRPESIFPLFALLQIAFTFKFIDSRWIRGGHAATIVFGAAALFAGVVCLSLKPSWGFAAAVPTAVIFFGCWPCVNSLRWRDAVMALGFGLVLIVCWLKFLPVAVGWSRDGASKTFLPKTLFTVHADLVSKSMHKRADNGLLDSDEITFLGELDALIQQGRLTAQRGYRLLGHDPDFLLYDSNIFDLLPLGAVSDIDAKSSYLWRAYIGAWRDSPQSMMRKIFAQIVRAHRNAGETLYAGRVDWSAHFSVATNAFAERKVPNGPAKISANFHDLMLQSSQTADTAPARRTLAPKLPAWLMSGVLSLLVGIFSLAGVAVLVAAPWLFRQDSMVVWKVSLVAFSILVTTSIGTITTVAVVHSFDVRRYLALLSLNHSLLFAVGTVLMIEFFFRSRAWRKLSDQQTSNV